MSDDPVETRVTVAGHEIGFQEYFVGRHHEVAVEAVAFRRGRPGPSGPGVLAAIDGPSGC